MPPIRKPSRNIRPTSATAKLQSHLPPSVLDEVRPATAAASLFAGGDQGRGTPTASRRGPATAWSSGDPDIPLPALPPRRLTVGHCDGLENRPETAAARARLAAPSSSGSKIEEKINLEHLHKLKQCFEKPMSANGTLTLEEFKNVIKNFLGFKKHDEQIAELFMKIDSLSEGKIAWDEFCTYMQLEYAEKEELYMRQREVSFQIPATIESMPHRESVLRITNMVDGLFVVVSQDGSISFWNNQMELKKTKTLMAEQNANRQKPKWITDMVLMQQYNKILLGTGDREIQFYESSTFEPYCQVSGLETVPLKLDYSSTGYDEGLVMYGDVDGCLNIIVMNAVGETLRNWKKMPKTDGIASVTLEKVAHSPLTKFVRWKVHDDWVLELKYFDEIRSVISCSNHENTALVIGCTLGSTHMESQLKDKDQSSGEGKRVVVNVPIAIKPQQNYTQPKKRMDQDQHVFKVYKGVKVFDFSKKKNVIITGGMDRIIRLWNPYVPGKPTGLLRGHNAPIFNLCIASEENRIYSISTDKTIKVWDIQDQACMLTIRPKTHKIKGELQACLYNQIYKSFALATDNMALLSLKAKTQQHADMVISHKEPIYCCGYNPSFNQVVSCSDGSVIKLWDFKTGNAIFEFSQAHGDHAITSMNFDSSGRRLITAGRDGKVKIWNFNNGHCLKTLQKDNNAEVTALEYVEINKNRYVIAVGWDKRINIFPDSADDFHHILKPNPSWPDDLKNGHKEDILSVASCPPNLLATSSYDGEIVVWNMVSGHIYCHLLSSQPSNYLSAALDGDNSIYKLAFMKTRATDKESAQLIASGPRGMIHFWNVFHGGHLWASFPGSKIPKMAITFMVVTSDDTTLFTSDALGFIYVWDVEGYCSKQKESEPPQLLSYWRAHVESVTSMSLVEQHSLLLSTSLDCTLRLWTTEGEFVGTFGQPEPWDIYSPSTFAHPMVPYDVLLDPQSMPVHPVLDGKIVASKVIHAESLENGNATEEEVPEEVIPEKKDEQSVEISNYLGTKLQFHYDDGMIADELKAKPFNKGTGKRLRHEKLKPVDKDWSGPNAYQSLKCFDLDDTPPISRPNTGAMVEST